MVVGNNTPSQDINFTDDSKRFLGAKPSEIVKLSGITANIQNQINALNFANDRLQGDITQSDQYDYGNYAIEGISIIKMIGTYIAIKKLQLRCTALERDVLTYDRDIEHLYEFFSRTSCPGLL